MKDSSAVPSDEVVPEADLALTAKLLDQIEVAFCLYDDRDRVVLWNEAYLTYFPEQRGHVRPGTLYADTLVRFFGSNLPPSELVHLDRHVEDAVARHHAQEEPFVFQRNTGRWLKVASLPTASGGRLRLWRDVTAEHAGTGGAGSMPRALAALDVGYAVFGRDGRFVTANKRYHEFFPDIGDLMHSGVPYARHLTCVSQALVEPHAASLRRLAERAHPVDDPLDAPRLVERRDGGWLQIEERFDPDGTLVSIWADATRQAQADATIMRLESYLRDALEAVPHGLLLFDRNDRLVVNNRRLAAIDVELARRMTLGASLSEYAEWYRRLLDGPRRVENPGVSGAPFADRDIELPDGRWLRTRSERTSQGDLLLLLTDISREKDSDAEIQRQREAMHQSEKLTALGSLLAGVAHELNNPLSIVVGRAALLQDTTLDPKVAAQARTIAAAAERCAKIVRTFLALARQRPPERRAVDVNTVVREAVQLLGYGLRSAGIDVAMKLGADVPELDADPDQLSQAVLNLMVNAQHAVSERPGPRRIGVSTAHDPEWNEIRIRVADNGAGVPAAIRNRVFEPFFTTKPVGSGTGLGLSVSLGSIQAHGGALDLEETPGGGATFVVRLPATPAAAAAEKPEPEPPPAGQRRILVVDDEPEVADLLRDILAGDGHRVELAASGREALERLDQGAYDLVISDLMMPELDGIGLHRELRRRGGDAATPIMFVTGDSLRSATGPAVRETGCAVIEKPFEAGEVRRLVRECLGPASGSG